MEEFDQTEPGTPEPGHPERKPGKQRETIVIDLLDEMRRDAENPRPHY